MVKRKERGLWLDSAEQYIRKYGWATCEMLRYSVLNADGLPYKEAPTPNQLPMLLRGDKRFTIIGKRRVKNYTVNMWGLIDG